MGINFLNAFVSGDLFAEVGTNVFGETFFEKLQSVQPHAQPVLQKICLKYRGGGNTYSFLK